MKKLLLKSVLLASITFGVHMLMGTIISFIVPPDQGYISYGVIGSIVYIFVVAFWAYLVFSFLYLLFTSKAQSVSGRFAISFSLMIIAYLLYRMGDIIDGDFFSRFDLAPLIVFLLTGPLMMITESFVNKRKPGSSSFER